MRKKTTKASPGRGPTAARREKEERIVAAARALLTRNPGATMDDMVRASGVSRATFFRVHRSRDALLRTVATAALAELEQALAAALAAAEGTPLRVRLRAAIAALVAQGEQLRFLAGAVELYKDPTIARAAAAADTHLAPLIDEAIEVGLLRADVSRAWMWAASDALVFAAWHEVSVGRLARADAARLVEQTLLEGFGEKRTKRGTATRRRLARTRHAGQREKGTPRA